MTNVGTVLKFNRTSLLLVEYIIWQFVIKVKTRF